MSSTDSRSEALKFHDTRSSRIHVGKHGFSFSQIFRPTPNDVQITRITSQPRLKDPHGKRESPVCLRIRFREFTLIYYDATWNISRHTGRTRPIVAPVNWSSVYRKKKIKMDRTARGARKKAHVHFRSLEFLWIFPWECFALARCSLGLRQWTARRRGKSYGATRRRIYPPFATPERACPPFCGTDTDPYRQVSYSFSTRERPFTTP